MEDSLAISFPRRPMTVLGVQTRRSDDDDDSSCSASMASRMGTTQSSKAQ